MLQGKKSFFPGYMALLLYGPFEKNINANRTLDFFLNSDPPKAEAKNYSRTAQRERKSSEAAFLRERESNRGAPMGDKIRIKDLQLKHTSLQMQSAQQTMFRHDSNLLAFSLRISSMDTRLNRELQRATVSNNWKRYEELENEQDTLHAEMAEAHTAANVVAEVSIPDLNEGLTYPAEDSSCNKKSVSSSLSIDEDAVSFL